MPRKKIDVFLRLQRWFHIQHTWYTSPDDELDQLLASYSRTSPILKRRLPAVVTGDDNKWIIDLEPRDSCRSLETDNEQKIARVLSLWCSLALRWSKAREHASEECVPQGDPRLAATAFKKLDDEIVAVIDADRGFGRLELWCHRRAANAGLGALRCALNDVFALLQLEFRSRKNKSLMYTDFLDDICETTMRSAAAWLGIDLIELKTRLYESDAIGLLELGEGPAKATYKFLEEQGQLGEKRMKQFFAERAERTSAFVSGFAPGALAAD